MTELVSISWLKENLIDKDLILLDASLQKTATGENSADGDKTIPGARYFDLKERFSDQNKPFPNSVPSQAQFEFECKKIGINQDSKIVVFDNRGIYSSPRVWWLFQIMGHKHISVLDGGLPEWVRQGLPVESRKTENYALGNFKASFHKEFVKTYEDVLANIDRKEFNVIDARSEGRFKGTENEPRKQLKSGHIPNSVNIPYKSILTKGKFKAVAELKAIFDSKCADQNDLVFSCGSGITACIVMLASEMVHKKGKYIYDGSWTEWATRQID